MALHIKILISVLNLAALTASFFISHDRILFIEVAVAFAVSISVVCFFMERVRNQIFQGALEGAFISLVGFLGLHLVFLLLTLLGTGRWISGWLFLIVIFGAPIATAVGALIGAVIGFNEQTR